MGERLVEIANGGQENGGLRARALSLCFRGRLASPVTRPELELSDSSSTGSSAQNPQTHETNSYKRKGHRFWDNGERKLR